ncbi:MAG: hypothetical protein ABIH82_05620 [Candidatus Woesearchaeota archaeon]
MKGLYGLGIAVLMAACITPRYQTPVMAGGEIYDCNLSAVIPFIPQEVLQQTITQRMEATRSLMTSEGMVTDGRAFETTTTEPVIIPIGVPELRKVYLCAGDTVLTCVDDTCRKD